MLALISYMGLGKQIRLFIMLLFMSSTSYGALMPLGQQLFDKNKENRKYSQSINVLDWIKSQKQIVLQRRSNINMNDYIATEKINNETSQSELSRNIIFTTFKNIDIETVERIKTGLKEVEKVTSTNYVISENGEEKTELKMRMDLIKSEAKIEFKGSLDAEVVYQISNAELHFALSKEINGTQLIAEHIQNSNEQTNTLGVRWDF